MALKISPSPAELNIKMTNILKIENFINDQSYSDLIEYSANFNARLCIERKLRLPFLDPQTGVAQKHSNLFMKSSQRIPGLKEGQIYTYPSQRWRCKKNSVKFNSRPFYRFRTADNFTTIVAPNPNLLPAAPTSLIAPPTSIISTSTTATNEGDVSDFQALIDAESNSLGGADTDSKDSQIVKDETISKEWFYDDMEVNDVNSEEQGDSDVDYNINGYKRKKKPVTARKSSRKPHSSESTKKRSSIGPSSNSRNNRSKKSSSSSRPSKSAESANRNFADVEPPSFDSVQDLFDGNSADKFGAYRSF